ncbi:FMN-binding protein [Sporofaciens sp. SGI.106]|uniref:FMN-binding protein n=1 Tax=Sporofaciens sp. SGI.106 TaxID=3420568 RepID=UPI003D07205C
MGSKTKIVVLHMKEIIYTAIFAVLAIILILLLVFMFRPGAKKDAGNTEKFTPGVYTSTVSLNNTALEVEVTVDESHINSIRFANLDETVTTMFPLIQPTMEEIAQQICEKQSLNDVQYSEQTPYTSQVIINAIDDALKKAAVK